MALPPEKSPPPPPWIGILGGKGKGVATLPKALLDMAGGGGTVAKGCALEGRTLEPLRR
jgi:hypothetical protein